MHQELDPSRENTLTRRDALKRAFKGSFATAVATPVILQAAPPAPAPPPEFVPENDYPFFGGELPEGFSDRR